ncbi:MAG: hypothetical protein Q4A92_11105 [Corynebacterium sp.]|nr:hypothetical protein [Corynebacterium sp.]
MSAEFRTLCHSLGLSTQALANYVQVSKRSAEHWFADGEPPKGVVDDVLRLDALIQHTIQQAIDVLQEAHEEMSEEPQDVELVVYRTAEAWHAAHPEYKGLPIQTHSIMLARTKQALANIGLPTLFRYAD